MRPMVASYNFPFVMIYLRAILVSIFLSTYISIYLRTTSKLKKGERAISVVAAPPYQRSYLFAFLLQLATCLGLSTNTVCS
jgi:hypothetical protein